VVGFFTDLALDAASTGVASAGRQVMLGELLAGEAIDYATTEGKRAARSAVTNWMFAD
jgi:hypothetical protein